MVITICNEKGGSGKSTIAVNLAFRFAKDYNLLLIDTDSQRSIEAFTTIRADSKSIKVKNPVNQKTQERNENILKKQEKSALRMQNEWDNALQSPNNHQYLINKKISAKGLKIDKFGNLLIHLKDIIWKIMGIAKNHKNKQ